jgi:hypothetical protein
MEEGGVKLPSPLVAALAVALLLSALSLVAWRQSRALDRLEELDRLEGAISLLTADRDALQSRVQVLESRGHVVPEAGERLDMRIPSDEAGEIIVLLPGATP